MKYNRNLLTEEQVNMLHFMIDNYYKKSMDICSCDVERVLTSETKQIPLLVIEVQDMSSVPSVIYKGDDIKGKVSISYGWETGGFKAKSKQNIKINHVYHDDDQLIDKIIQEETVQ
ncbi:hypothetical protein [Bacillus thuringiensis]|uniref:hypothetical protein n=1 Tax=Bacillus thuringiensis TaxID=1428 RepID=UPI0011584CCB|nr:hypothetical protein [Bacillus thuringiensis]